MNFKEWLSQDAPTGAGEIWNNFANSGYGFDEIGIRSKTTSPDGSEELSKFNPKKLFYGKNKKRIGKK